MAQRAGVAVPGRGLGNWGQRRSLWVLLAGAGCCRPGALSLGSPPFDWASRGVRLCTTPEEADVLLVLGPVSLKMIPVLRALRSRMRPPRWLVAAGACACSGGGVDTYAAVQGLDLVLPVDVHVAGCPPAPEDLIDALEMLQGRRPL